MTFSGVSPASSLVRTLDNARNESDSLEDPKRSTWLREPQLPSAAPQWEQWELELAQQQHPSTLLSQRLESAGRQRRRTARGGAARERRVPPAGAVAEVIREKGPTRILRRRRRPPYPVPSNGPPSAPATHTAPRSKRKKAPAPLRHRGRGPPPGKKCRGMPHAESPAAWRGGRRGDCSPSRGTCPVV
ncbi:unnamed protein product [Pleuronectes platessa]|uniref:Uncharacterized protein n=1 Tax=Pleuronectes platessa TaxID=8262 RepID=A0A9N7YBG0_PLEPL|nr:unnamed protein product [Pleuronectes platessa]